MLIEVSGDANSAYTTAFKLFLSFYGVWNLDFFRPFYSNLCLGIGILPTLALDYAVAVYPLVLMLITYILIVMYNKNCRVVTTVFNPFHKILSQSWNIKTSVVHAFATFFFLSNMKFLSVSLDLLIPTQLFWLYPDHYNTTLGLFYAGDIGYFGTEHLPYAILATVVLLVFVLLPVLLLAFYPFAFFQKFLNLFPFRWYILHTFVDSFYGCYKDGTQPGTRDCRWCASVYFIIRVTQLACYALSDKNFYNILTTLILILFTTLIATLKPFKPFVGHHNVIHIIFLQCLTIFSITAFGIVYSVVSSPQFETFFFSVATIVAIIPVVYLVASILYWLHKHKAFTFNIFHRLNAWRSGYEPLAENNDLPDRIENSTKYPRENLAIFPAQP